MVVPVGTGATIEFADQLVAVADIPLKVTVLVPCVAAKPAPLMVTEVPTGPDVGERALMLGFVTVNRNPLLACPPTVTTMFPVVAPAGTGTTIEVALQFMGAAVTPLNVMELVPWVAPKFVPVTLADVPIAPAAGMTLAMCGCVITVNSIPLLLSPFTVTTTNPDVAPTGTETAMLVALQLVGVAGTPLKAIVLDPCVAPKLEPLTVIAVPTAPEAGDSPVMIGLGITVKLTPLLPTPPAAVTTTLPDVAAVGTVAVILVAPQELTVAAAPLKFTLPLP